MQEPPVDFTGQDAAPELPSQVEALPIAYGYWLLFLAAAVLLLWWSWHWMRAARRQRKKLLQEQRVVAAEASASSAQRTLSMLRGFVQELSKDQRREAQCLSHLLREQCGRSLQRDCHSATDTELLQQSDSLAPRILAPLLSFTSGILFADQRPAAAIWKATLKDVQAWLETQEQQA